MGYRRKRRPRSRASLFAGATVLAAIAALAWALSQTRQSVITQFPTGPHFTERSLPVRPASLRQGRPSYTYSVIRGGAYSIPELDAVLRDDPVVAGHYAVFERAKLTMSSAPAAKLAYVSYRMGDQLYWTRRPVRIARDEILISDGTHFARARCGNRISDTPQAPTAVDDAALERLDTIEASSPGSLLVPEIFPRADPIQSVQDLLVSIDAAPWDGGTFPAGVASLSPGIESLEGAAAGFGNDGMVAFPPAANVWPVLSPGTNSVPEPSSCLMLAALLLGCACLCRFSFATKK
jgi:hypothetical protein